MADTEVADHGHGEAEPGQRPAGREPSVAEQVGLAMRAFRREQGWSQRALAAEFDTSQSAVARMERSAGGVSLNSVLDFLNRAGFSLAVVDADRNPVTTWERSDLLAKDRSGRRFPAHRTVRESRHGPRWWQFHEYFGHRADGPQPAWTAEGFDIPEGTRFGKKPRPYAEGEGLRWPY